MTEQNRIAAALAFLVIACATVLSLAGKLSNEVVSHLLLLTIGAALAALQLQKGSPSP